MHAALIQDFPSPRPAERASRVPAAPVRSASLAVDAGDAALVCGRVRAGDADAFETLYRAWYPRVYAMSRRLTGRDESFCQDATHEVMLRVAKSLPALTGEGALEAWMARTTLSASVDALRAEQRRVRREKAHAASRPSANAGGAEAGTELAWLHDHLARLDHVDYALVMARIGHGQTLREAGLSAGVSEDAAHGRLRRALTRLRDAARRAGR